ncbi:MAG TPA: AAC(3) family N-acetyltransferase [Xanthobacteraceae bacterium]|jgi:aminoglycoside 3-N-acetyltransferase|nr:AAC(3) family N-acetyltransferase [Xanthobacteraceae bacterium]
MAGKRERDALIPILERMRVPHDGVLVVHSAIATLSRAGFRAEAMIDTLLDYVSKGTLVMPTMTWRSVTPQQRNWDEIETRSETGVMTEIFRTRYASRRSIHPTHSVAAHGAAADMLVARHHLDDTPVSANSPHGLMRSYDSFVMMLGVGLESCTAIHLPEETIAPDFYLRPLNPDEVYPCRDRHGRVHNVRTRRHFGLDRDFPKFGPPLRQRGLLQAGTIEGCPYAIVALQDLLDAVSAALRADPRGTLRETLAAH